jgi:hypothetical protein
MKHLHTNIQIANDRTCYDKKGNHCSNNGTFHCHKCAIYSGNTEVPIRFTTSQYPKQAPKPEFNPKELLRPPLQTEVLIEDEADIPNILKHVSVAITHKHSGNLKFHRHFVIDNIFAGNHCYICGFPVVGIHICGYCQSMFESSEDSDQCFT